MFEEPLTEAELDVHGALFGWKFSEGGSNGLVSIYVEDDENWHRKMTFDISWLEDFKCMSDALCAAGEPLTINGKPKYEITGQQYG